MKKFNLTIALLLFGFISINAQSDETKEKLKNLEGDITKITIETEDGEIEITGDDAEVLFKRMKAKKHIMIKEMHHGDIDKNGNVMFFKKGMHSGNMTIDVDIDIDDADGEKVVIIKKNIDGKKIVEEYKGEEAEKFLKKHSAGKHGNKFITDDGKITVIMEMDSDDLHWVSETDGKDIKKEINVEVNDGVKKVTVTTTEDGNENVEVYEGEEAEKFLESHSKGGKKLMFISEDDDMTIVNIDSDVLHWTSEGDHEGIMKKVNVEVEDGVKTVTITTTEDGKDKVEVFTGDEAEEYLSKMKHGKKMKIHISEDGDKKVMKKKVIIIEEKDDDKDKD